MPRTVFAQVEQTTDEKRDATDDVAHRIEIVARVAVIRFVVLILSVGSKNDAVEAVEKTANLKNDHADLTTRE